jgi:hypothetical protein
VRQRITNRDVRIRRLHGALLDAIVEREVARLDTPFEEQRGGERLRQTGYVVRRVRARANRVLNISEAKARIPHNPLVLNDGGGQCRDVRLDAQRVEISLEQRQRELLLSGRVGRDRGGHEER